MARPTDYTPELLEKAREYLKDEHSSPAMLSVAGLALYLGVARSTIYDWASQEDKKEFSDIIETLLASQEVQLTEGGLLNEFNPTITKLMLTKHGYSDRQDVTSGDKPIQPLLVKFIDAKHDADTEGV